MSHIIYTQYIMCIMYNYICSHSSVLDFGSGPGPRVTRSSPASVTVLGEESACDSLSLSFCQPHHSPLPCSLNKEFTKSKRINWVKFLYTSVGLPQFPLATLFP